MRLGDITQLRMKNPDNALVLSLLREIELYVSSNKLLQRRIDELKADLAKAGESKTESHFPKPVPSRSTLPSYPAFPEN